jgi:hypothetical protein
MGACTFQRMGIARGTIRPESCLEKGSLDPGA